MHPYFMKAVCSFIVIIPSISSLFLLVGMSCSKSNSNTKCWKFASLSSNWEVLQYLLEKQHVNSNQIDCQFISPLQCKLFMLSASTIRAWRIIFDVTYPRESKVKKYTFPSKFPLSRWGPQSGPNILGGFGGIPPPKKILKYLMQNPAFWAYLKWK